jgi:hypothetical protein
MAPSKWRRRNGFVETGLPKLEHDRVQGSGFSIVGLATVDPLSESSPLNPER